MIKIYTTDICPRCKILKAKLQFKKIEYIESHDEKEMQDLGIMTVPYMQVENKLMDFAEANAWINQQ
jgi:glutaredoxin